MSWGYDAWKLQSPEDAGFYRFNEDEEDDMDRETQLLVEARAYLRLAREHCRSALLTRHSKGALKDIASMRDALHEAAQRHAERQRIDDARDDMPF